MKIKKNISKNKVNPKRPNPKKSNNTVKKTNSIKKNNKNPANKQKVKKAINTDKNKTIINTKGQKTIIKERISTGIPKLDQMISGGLISESINLIEGGSGSGKTIIAMQYLFEGIKKGESVMYVTFEEKKEDFYKNMKKLGWDLNKAEQLKKFIFLEYSPEKVKMMLDEGGGAIESLVLRNKIKRMVIDSITSFSLLFDNLLEKRGANLGLFDIIKKWGCTTLFTVQHDPSTKKEKDIALLEFEVDGIINLYFDIIGNKRKRFIEVMKMRRTKHASEIYSFTIDNGIKIGQVEKGKIPQKKKNEK